MTSFTVLKAVSIPDPASTCVIFLYKQAANNKQAHPQTVSGVAHHIHSLVEKGKDPKRSRLFHT